MSKEMNQSKQNETEVKEVVEVKSKGMNKKTLGMLIGALVIAVGVLVVAMTMSGHGGSVKAQGTWLLTQVVNDQETLEGELLSAAYGGEVIYDLQKEGKLVITMIGQEFTGEWTQSGNKVELTYNGGLTELEYHGETMTMEGDGIKYTMEPKK